jgi:hypothetical protein
VVLRRQALAELTIAMSWRIIAHVEQLGWHDLRVAYEKRGLVLVLGAGVSRDSGLPDWGALLARVADDCGERGVMDELSAGAIPFPVAASVLENRFGDRRRFVEAVREALYRDLPDVIRTGDPERRRTALIAHVSGNTTMNAVASMCAAPRKHHAGYKRNSAIAAVVTFNLDAVLQAYVTAQYRRSLLRTTERVSAGAKPHKINLYHMHGHLRFDHRAGNFRAEAPDAVVLTEQDYFDAFNNPTSMFNYTFLYLLREWQCLFVGLSMDDGNLRRLLHLSTRERLGGYHAEGITEARVAARAQRHFAILRQEGTTERNRAVEDALLMLGTRVLWVDQFEQIDGALGRVYEARGSWDAVRWP